MTSTYLVKELVAPTLRATPIIYVWVMSRASLIQHCPKGPQVLLWVELVELLFAFAKRLVFVSPLRVYHWMIPWGQDRRRVVWLCWLIKPIFQTQIHSQHRRHDGGNLVVRAFKNIQIMMAELCLIDWSFKYLYIKLDGYCGTIVERGERQSGRYRAGPHTDSFPDTPHPGMLCERCTILHFKSS